MPSKDMVNNISLAQSLAPAVRDADANGTGVDLAGYESVTLVFDAGAEGVTLSGTDKIALEWEESDDNSTFTDIAAADMDGEEAAGVAKTLDANAEAPAMYAVGYKGSKRYVRAVANFSGTHGTGTPLSAFVIRGAERHA